MSCPDEAVIQLYVDVQLPDDEAAAVEAHVDTCPACRSLIAALASPDAETDEPGTSLAPGARLGRYVVVGQLGKGGMGLVLSAYDPELDRGVALKIVRPSAFEQPMSRAPERLLEEARALARLSHPNVVAIHDVGTVGAEVFLAMERVPGPTLRDWLDTEPRGWRAVRQVFVQAGAGLAAAHAAGMVHRDFKLDNVIVGNDGRVRVTDFGLARPARSGAPLAPGTPPPAGAPTTALAGTPAYMAPEVLAGSPADHRSDQYSFCVALHEALYGHRPADAAGTTGVPPRRARVPGWLAAVLRRGLSQQPEQRFASMHELLHALWRDRRSRRHRLAAAVAVALALPVGLLVLGELRSGAGARCSGATAQLAGVWDAQAKQRVSRAFAALGGSVAQTAARQVAQSLDAHATRWRAVYTEACLATHVREERSPELLDRQMACLEGGRRELRELVRLFRAADQQLAERAVRAVDELAPPERCGRIDLLEARVPEPAVAEERAHLDEARTLLAEALAVRRAGRDAKALPLATKAVEVAAQSGWAPIEGRALHALARVEQDLGEYTRSEQTLYEALWTAQRGIDAMTVAEVWVDLVYVEAYLLSHYDRAGRLANHAEAAIARAGGDPLLSALLADHLGIVRWRQARYAEAAEHHEAALAARIAQKGEAHPAVAQGLTNLGIVRRGQGRLADAIDLHERAIEIGTQAYGADHPSVGRYWNNLASALYSDGQIREALAANREALRIFQLRYGDSSPMLFSSVNNIGTNYFELGNLEAAEEYYRRALRIAEVAFGPEDVRVGTPLTNLGELEVRRGEAKAAVQQFERALEVWEAAHGAEHPRVALALTGLGEALLDSGREAAGVEKLERAWKIVQRSEGDAADRAQTAFALARARLAAGRGKGAAVPLAVEARNLYRTRLPAEADRLDTVEQWLAEHR